MSQCSIQKTLGGWMDKKKEDPSICCLWETHFILKDTEWPKVKEWKRYYMQIKTNKETNKKQPQVCNTCIRQNRFYFFL